MVRWQRSDGIAAGRRQTNQPTYEDFQPMFERNEEEAYHVITLSLPGLLIITRIAKNIIACFLSSLYLLYYFEKEC